jgi:hypothetical protein
MLGIPIYGNCVFSEQKFLTKEFFFPDEKIKEILRRDFKESISIEEAIKFGMKIFFSYFP